LILWGYRSDEVVTPAIWPKQTSINRDQVTLDPSLRLKRIRENDRNVRKPVAGSLGMHVQGAACPHPDQFDTSTTLDGALYRVCPQIPGYAKHKRKFRKFVKKWCKKNLTPLANASDTTVESWLKKCNYTEKRKEELLKKFNAVKNKKDKRYAFIKSFIKDEFYPDYKHARTINSRTDEYKTFVGPIFQLISDELFARPEFIKKVPVDDRPEAILRDIYVENEHIYSTDFSSFEAHFRKVIMEDCEFVLYKYMVKELADGDEFLDLIEAMKGKNRIEFKNLVLEIEAKRMSGEMNTSLGNGFSNLMFILYVCSLKDKKAPVRVKVEGDDSIFGTRVNLTTKDFADFGLRIKLEEHKDICRASFCGMVFDPIDMTNVTDPRDVLATFGWTSAKYIRSKRSVHLTLLRCKALSLAYQYPCCPILTKLANNVLRMTAGYETKRFIQKQGTNLMCNYELEILLLAQKQHTERQNKKGQYIFKEPGLNTRRLVEELYGITVNRQIDIEKYFDNMTEIGPMVGDLFLDIMNPVWKQYFDKYSANIRPKMAVYENPGPLWTAIRERRLKLD
jgi:hypothetical protein